MYIKDIKAIIAEKKYYILYVILFQNSKSYLT